MADQAPNPLTTPGTYFVAVVTYPDGSGILGTYGPWQTKAGAEKGANLLREAGIYEHEQWTVLPLRKIDLGPANG